MKLTLNTIKPARGSKKSKKVVGRGNASGHGTFSTRGCKGQRARSGGRAGLSTHAIKELVQSTPKLRGFKSFKIKPITVTLSQLEKSFKDGDVVSIETLKEKNILRQGDKKAKITSRGELKKKLNIQVQISKGAAEAVAKAGGEVAKVAEKTAEAKEE